MFFLCGLRVADILDQFYITTLSLYEKERRVQDTPEETT